MNRLTKKLKRSLQKDKTRLAEIEKASSILNENFLSCKDGMNHLLQQVINNILIAIQNEVDLLQSLEEYYKGPHIKIWIPIVPPGINATYGVNCKGKQKVYKTKEAKEWEKAAIMPIRSAANYAGFVVNPETDKLIIYITIQGSGHDVDAPIKMIVDTVARTLGFDDKIVINVHSTIDRENSERGVLIEIEKDIL